METFLRVMRFLNGKKTVLAAIASQILIWAFVKGYVDADTVTMIAGVTTILTGVGVGHKALKGEFKP